MARADALQRRRQAESRRAARLARAALFALLAALLPAFLSACASAPLRQPVAAQMPWAPKALLDLESGAERVFDAALAGDWAAASRDTRTVTGNWPAVRREVTQRHVDAALVSRADAAVRDLAAAVASRDGIGAAEKANGVTGYASGFMNLFRMTVPPPIPTLDFQARGALLQARAGEWKAAEAYVGALDGTLLAYFPTARAQRPQNLARIERLAAALSKDVQAKDAPSLETHARKFIAEVATLRQTYATGK